jgi:hypothetical protein
VIFLLYRLPLHGTYSAVPWRGTLSPLLLFLFFFCLL